MSKVCVNWDKFFSSKLNIQTCCGEVIQRGVFNSEYVSQDIRNEGNLLEVTLDKLGNVMLRDNPQFSGYLMNGFSGRALLTVDDYVEMVSV